MGQGTVLCPILALIANIIIIEKQASIKSLIPKTPRGQALGVSQSLPRARGKEALALPVAEKARAPFPQRSKTARISVSPQQFSGTARWTGGPLAVDEVPAKRILDSIVPGQVGRGTVPRPMWNNRSSRYAPTKSTPWAIDRPWGAGLRIQLCRIRQEKE